MMESTEFKRLKELVEEHLPAFLPEIDNKSGTLHESMIYSLTAGGKRIRPVLLLGASEFCGGNVKLALPYACGIEYIHTYSLIHDDLPAMDDDDYRRGILTNHKVYGEGTAILAGDGLLNSAFETMTKDILLYLDDPKELRKRIRAVYEIAKGAGVRGMIAGQMADIESEGKSCTKELLDYIHINKTAALFTAAIRAGAYLGGADVQKLRDLTDYAECIGLAFQIADDVLDVCGDVDIMGKEAGKDCQLEKCTFPSLYGLDNAKSRLQGLTDRALEIMAPYYDEAELFTDLAKELAIRTK